MEKIKSENMCCEGENMCSIECSPNKENKCGCGGC